MSFFPRVGWYSENNKAKDLFPLAGHDPLPHVGFLGRSPFCSHFGGCFALCYFPANKWFFCFTCGILLVVIELF